jgi:hypothetical protein
MHRIPVLLLVWPDIRLAEYLSHDFFLLFEGIGSIFDPDVTLNIYSLSLIEPEHSTGTGTYRYQIYNTDHH